MGNIFNVSTNSNETTLPTIDERAIFKQKMEKLLPLIKVPVGLSIGSTGYPSITENIPNQYGRFFDEYGREWMIIDNYIIFQRYPNNNLFMGGKMMPYNAINNNAEGEMPALLKRAEEYAKTNNIFQQNIEASDQNVVRGSQNMDTWHINGNTTCKTYKMTI